MNDTDNTTIGDVPAPSRPVVTSDRANVRITDLEEHHRTRPRVIHQSQEGDGPLAESVPRQEVARRAMPSYVVPTELTGAGIEGVH